MSSKNDLKRHSGETELAFINRLGRMNDSGLLDMTWTELSNIFNQELREPGQEYTESAYRKKYATIKRFKYEAECENAEPQEAKELIKLKRDLEKEKVKVILQYL